MPSNLAHTAFSVVVPEIWKEREPVVDEDEGILHIRPVKYSTRMVVDTYKQINPRFSFKPKYTPPQKVLTNPSIPRHNEGYDNENYDLIMHAGDVLGSDSSVDQGALAWRKGSRYTLIDVLGQGTFGQVIKCRDETTNKLVAIKVLKNKPAYFKQGLLEIAILTVMNTNTDPTGERRTLRFYDHFLFRNHLCLVNELLGMNLYEVVKQNGYRGLNITLIRTYTRQILDALMALNDAAIIHCDLKPENVLLQKPHSTDVMLIDFGSACFEKSTMYTYIQSRHYRSPEVILGLRYTCAIDMWSLGCIAAELFIGIPIFPGANEYNQLFKIIDLLGNPPAEMIKIGSRASKFFKPDFRSENGYRMKSHMEYEAETGIHIDHDKKYHVYRTLQELVMKYPMKNPAATDPATSNNPACQDKEVRRSFLHFLQGCLQMDPTKRWTADQARAHPFLNEQVLPDDWTPPPPKHPVPPNAPPKPKEPSSRSQPDVNAYYSRFCAALMNHNVIDAATGTVLTELNYPLNPPPADKTVPQPTGTRGNRAIAIPVSGTKAGSVAGSPTSSSYAAASPAAGASSLTPFKIRYPPRGIPVGAGAGYDSSQGPMTDFVSASANVATAAELRARMASGGSTSRGLGERKKSVRPKRQHNVGLAVDTTTSALQDQPFNMDGEDHESGEDTPSEGSNEMMSPTTPHEKRMPIFNNIEQDRPEEIAASWSYMPQSKNAGMPRVRPQQPGLQEAMGPYSKNTPLSFATSSTAGSFTDSTPRHKSKSKHRNKEDTTQNSSDANSALTRSPLTALTFGNPTLPASPLSDAMGNMTLCDPSGSSSSGSKQPQIEVRVRTTPRKEDEPSSPQQEKDE